jgi:ATP-dependent 26S proteasome regulatory subunit
MEEEAKGKNRSVMNILGRTTIPTSNAATTQTVPINRYQHDLEFAAAMRRRGKEKKKKEVTESEILLGLNGLDKAEELRDSGDLDEALKISKLSMQLLLEFLRSDPSVLPSISRDTVSARVHSALTDAEEMKQTLKTRHPKTKLTTQPEKKENSTSQALADALARASKESPKSRSSNPKQTPGQNTSSTSKQVSNQSSPQNSTSPTSSVKSRFFNSQDPLVKTVKSDLYVDHSQLENTSWDDIAGLATAKQSLQEAAILPLMRPDLFTGLRKPRNILLYGPPGTGKTMLVKAVAKESQCLLFVCTASSLTSKWHGEGEKLLTTLFQVARAAAPSIIFVDEVDALLSSRKSEGEHEASRRFKTEFMTQVDGIVSSGTGDDTKHLLVIACTNCPWDIDSAVLRRFPRRIYIPLPDTKTRSSLLKKLLQKAGKHNLKSADMKAVIKRLHGFSGSDVASIASEASFGPLRSLGGVDAIRGANAMDLRPISRSDFDKAIDQATKSVSKNLLDKYDEWKNDQAAK